MMLCLAGALLAGCSIFDDEERLAGDRIPVRGAEARDDAGPARVTERALPPAQEIAAWTQTNGAPTHNSGHLAGPARPERVWSADAGTGTSDDSALTSAPVVADGRVFVLDAAARVSAFDAGSGAERWSTSLVPSEEEDGEEGFGGGLAISDGTLVATTGFGEVLALDAASGEVLWREALGAPLRAAPAVDGGRVLAVTRTSEAFALDLSDGSILWRHRGVIPGAAFLGGASPALVGNVALVPYPSGELIALEARSGRQAWTAVMTGGRRGLARSAITDLTGDPVAVGPFVVSANQSGRIAAFEGSTGRRAWTRGLGSTRPPWPAGDTIFVVSDRARVVRLDARTGETLWSRALPAFEDPEDREDPIAYSGPVLVGGRVIVTDSLGNIWSLDGITGEGDPVAEVPGGSLTGPVVAGGTLYLLSEDATLFAYR